MTTDAEIDHVMAAQPEPIIDPSLALFAETPAGKAIGLALDFPDFNHALHKLNGWLTPLGILKLSVRRRRITRLRVLLLGLLEEWRGKDIDALLYLLLFRNVCTAGMRETDISWILEGNHRINAAIERMGGKIYRTYRLYEASL